MITIRGPEFFAIVEQSSVTVSHRDGRSFLSIGEVQYVVERGDDVSPESLADYVERKSHASVVEMERRAKENKGSYFEMHIDLSQRAKKVYRG